MKPRLFLSALVCVCATLSLTASAQVDPVRFNAIKKRLQKVADTYHKFPAATQPDDVGHCQCRVSLDVR